MNANSIRIIFTLTLYTFFLFPLSILGFQEVKKPELIDIEPEILLRRVKKDSNLNLIRDANSISKGYINFNARWVSYAYENEIDWTVNPFNNPSWLNSLFSLRMIGILTTAYEVEPNDKYLEKSIELLHSWNDNYKKEDLLALREYKIWNDHATANRVINLIHFHSILKSSKKIDKATYDLIIEHLLLNGEWLFDDKNYTAGNHAVMMDIALLYLSYALPKYDRSVQWQKKALQRFSKIIDEEVTEEGVCVENSPQYHPFMMDLLKNFIQLQQNFNVSPLKRHIELLEKMKSYLVYVLKPDLRYPFQGDSYASENQFFFSKDYPDPRFDFIESKGLKGLRPSKVDVVYYNAGYAILRDDWKTGLEYETSTYINFIAGFPSRVHKHSDNLSFSLYANKENLLIDPGSWGYAKNDTVSYLKSTKAHNTFTINGNNYSNFPLENSKIIATELSSDYSMVEGVFKPNPFVEFYRKLIFIKPNYIILDDHVYSSKKINETEQIFNLGLELKDYRTLSDNTVIADFEHNSLEITQLIKNNYEVQNFSGGKGIRGVYALKAERSINGNQIVFKASNDSIKYHFHNRTLLKIHNNLKSTIENINISENTSDIIINWVDNKRQHRELKLEKTIRQADVLGKNLSKAVKYSIDAPNIFENFGIQDFRILKWLEGEYSIIFKLSEDTTVEQLRKYTIGIRGEAYKNDSALLSTYARQVGLNYEAWNIKENDIVETAHGKFISINLSTKIQKFKNFKIFIFDRSGYKRELWSYNTNGFYLNSDLKNIELIQSINSGKNIAKAKALSEDLKIENIILNKTVDQQIVYIEVPSTITEEIISKYKIGLHTYVQSEDMEKLLDYSKAKNRDYDSWDFNPMLTQLDGKTYIIKKMNTTIEQFLKIKIFLYNSAGYKGVIGDILEIKDIR